jgi:hypothetical protein
VDAIEEDGTKQDRETRDAVVTELLQSLAKLKHSSPKNSEKWHAYNYILHAVVPAQYKHPELLAKYIGSSWTKVTSVSKNKILINEKGDWGVGHSVKTRKDAFRVQYAEYLPRIEGWWTSGGAQTQTSAYATVENHVKGNHTINKDLHHVPDGISCAGRGRGQRLSLSHVPHGITWHFAFLNSACYRSRN